MTSLTPVVRTGVLLTMLVMLASLGMARMIDLDPPGDREFVKDLANLITPADREAIVTQCTQLLNEKATPIVVLTIGSMAEFGGRDMRIESFARVLFDDWQIGHEKISGQDWNTGILLLVSDRDRRARIELGTGWGREKDALCQKIMDGQIVPNFKQAKFSEGIVAGVDALDSMARGLKLPRRVRPWWHYALVVGMIGLTIFTITSLVRRGASGWAWVFWAAVLGFLWYFLIQMLKNSGKSSGDGGSFGGGSFGGGSSGGGGASGSW